MKNEKYKSKYTITAKENIFYESKVGGQFFIKHGESFQVLEMTENTVKFNFKGDEIILPKKYFFIK